MARRSLAALTAACFLLMHPTAYAGTCGNPAGPEGDVMYNYDFHTYQYCNGTYWIAFDPSVGISTTGPQTIFLTSGTTWTVPSDWNSANNTIEVIGGGGGGANGATNPGGGGGGGAYSLATNVALTPGATVTMAIAMGGPVGTAGGDSYLCNSTSNCASIAGTAVVVGAKGGNGTTTRTGGTGGATTSGVGATKYAGGNGGDGLNNTGGGGGGGGGGSAGPSGAGKNGGSPTSSAGGGGGGGGANGGSSATGASPSAEAGGAGGNGTAGTGGGAGGVHLGSGGTENGADGTAGGGGGGGGDASPDVGGRGGNGGSDTAFDATHGAGGGGGGAGDNDGSNMYGGNGGLYGGGGGGRTLSGPGTAGTGAQGIIVIKYTPATVATCGVTSGLVGHWKLDESTGTTAADASGNSNTGTLVNGPTWGTGKVGSAVNFDAVNDRINIANEANFDFDRTSPFSIAGWFNQDYATNHPMMAKWTGVPGYGVGPTLSGSVGSQTCAGNCLYFGMQNSSGSAEMAVMVNNAITLGTWMHFVATYDGSSAVAGMKLYLNGSLASTVSTASATMTGSILNNNSFMLGHDGNVSYAGSIDDARVYNRELTAGEVLQIYNSGNGCP